MLQNHGTLLENAMKAFLEPTEVYAVQIESMQFLIRATEILMETDSIDDESMNLKVLISNMSRLSLLTKIKGVMSSNNLPPLFISSIVDFVTLMIKADFKKSLPVLT